jgi:hypothetical protein
VAVQDEGTSLLYQFVSTSKGRIVCIRVSVSILRYNSRRTPPAYRYTSHSGPAYCLLGWACRLGLGPASEVVGAPASSSSSGLPSVTSAVGAASAAALTEEDLRGGVFDEPRQRAWWRHAGEGLVVAADSIGGRRQGGR